jgi:hypothetical protein
VDQILFLILILTLPGIIKRIVKQGKPSPPAAPTRRRSAEAPPPVAESDLPPWLQDLAEKLGGAPSQPEPTAAETWAGPHSARETHPARTQRPSFAEEGLTDAEAHPEIVEGSAAERGSWDVTPGADWQRFEAEREQERAAAASILRDREHPSAQPAASALAAVPTVTRHRPRHFIPPGRQGWRRAIVLAEVLGPPRAVTPWRESGGS